MTSTTEMPWRWLDPSRLASSPPADGRPEAQRPVIARETVGVCVCRVRFACMGIACHLPLASSKGHATCQLPFPVPLARLVPLASSTCMRTTTSTRVMPLVRILLQGHATAQLALHGRFGQFPRQLLQCLASSGAARRSHPAAGAPAAGAPAAGAPFPFLVALWLDPCSVA